MRVQQRGRERWRTGGGREGGRERRKRKSEREPVRRKGARRGQKIRFTSVLQILKERKNLVYNEAVQRE